MPSRHQNQAARGGNIGVHFSVEIVPAVAYSIRCSHTMEIRMAVLPSSKEMDRAFHRRDFRYDGLFYVGVSSTGIFCRPSCSARKPLRRNVHYFATPREALFAGYRPCKRCSPLSAIGAPPSWAARLLADVDRHPKERITDAKIKSMGIDPARVRRYFRRHHGMTFQAYCRARRLGEALEQIRKGTRL